MGELFLKSKFSLSGVKTIRSVLTCAPFDIVHSFTGRALSAALFASVGIPVKHVAYRGTVGHLSRLDPSSWCTFLNPRLSKIVCVSNAVREYLISMGVPSYKTKTIYKGHSLSWYDSLVTPSRESLNIPPDAFVIGCTANMRPVKGVDLLVEALPLVPKDLNVHLLLVGEVRDERILTLAQNPAIRDRIHFTGFRRDATSLIRACNCTVMASREREGLPKAVIESMAQSIPPIVTKIGGMPELVEDALSGLVIPPKDIGALAAAMTRMARSPELVRSLGNGARRRIERFFAIEGTIDAHAHLYSELVPSLNASSTN